MNTIVLKFLVSIGILFSVVFFGVAAYVFVSWWDTYGREHWSIKHRKELLMRFKEENLIDKVAFGRLLDDACAEAMKANKPDRYLTLCDVSRWLDIFPLGTKDCQ